VLLRHKFASAKCLHSYYEKIYGKEELEAALKELETSKKAED